MAFLYHRVPHNLEGETLYPLNQLRKTHPKVYESAVAKYEGREQLRERRIPFLNCLWNDVLHLSPVHPEQVRAAFATLGQPFHSSHYYRLEADRLPAEETVTYLYRKKFEQDKMNPDNWERFDPEKIGVYSDLPPETIKYFQQCFSEGKRPLMWVYVPHILYRGTLNIRDLERIEV